MNAAKLHASLAAAMALVQDDPEPVPIIVKTRRGPIARGEARALSAMQSSCDFRFMDARAIHATPDMIAALTDDPGVDLIWPDLPVHTWLDDAVPLIGVPRIWESGFTGRGVKIAVLDTGIDERHPDLAGRVIEYRDFVAPDAPEASSPRDRNGHGTHVAGIVAGDGAGADGRWRGAAHEASLVVGRVLDAAGGGRMSNVMAGIEWALDQGARVINISLGGPPFPSDGTDALSLMCDAAVEQGAVVCVAAGNLGPAGQTIGSPGAARQVVTVGASHGDPASPTDQVAGFSSRGPTGDGRVKPDLVMPGVGIVAPRATGTSLGVPVDELYTALRGTSQATPLVTATVALLLQANPRLTPAEIHGRLTRGAHRIPGFEPVAQGAGRGDAYNTFIAGEGSPLAGDDGSPPPEQEPAGCLHTVSTLLAARKSDQ